MMFDNERPLNEFMMNYMNLLMADIEEGDMDHLVGDNFNPPRWILGHLAIYSDYALRMLGGRFQCPKQWHRKFARGSHANSVPEDLPTRTELMERIESSNQEIRRLSLAPDVGEMAKNHSVPFLQGSQLVTVGNVVAHLMTTHPAAHLGQLSAWRRVSGRSQVEPGAVAT